MAPWLTKVRVLELASCFLLEGVTREARQPSGLTSPPVPSETAASSKPRAELLQAQSSQTRTVARPLPQWVTPFCGAVAWGAPGAFWRAWVCPEPGQCTPVRVISVCVTLMCVCYTSVCVTAVPTASIPQGASSPFPWLPPAAGSRRLGPFPSRGSSAARPRSPPWRLGALPGLP